MPNSQQRLLLFVGSYADAANSGVYVYELDQSNEKFHRLHEVSGLKNPTFLNVDAEKKKLYSISENTDADGGRVGEVVSFSIDTDSGSLTEENRISSIKPSTCHIQRDFNNKYLIVSGYHGGNVGLIKLDEQGQLIQLTDEKQHEGHGPNAERQDRAHTHSAQFSPDNRFALVADLGIDEIIVYRLDTEGDQLVRQGEGKTAPGAGPRHVAFHPNGQYLYSINEVDSTITLFDYVKESGSLTSRQTVPTLPEDYKGENTTAEIVISRDGRFLYGSNRGHDSIVQYAIDQNDGTLTFVERLSTEGGHPRHFALTPGGDFLIAANRDSDHLVLFRVNSDTGRLQFTGHTAEVSKPVCIQPVIF